MRRYFALLLCLLVVSVALNAQTGPAQMKFKLLGSNAYDVDMYFSSELQRLFIQVDYDMPKADLDTTSYFGIFLSKSASIQGMVINGTSCTGYEASGLSPDLFDPVIKNRELFDKSSPVAFSGLKLLSWDSLPDPVHVTLWYYLRIPTFTLNPINKLGFTLDSNKFWYPRDPSRLSTVRLKLRTSKNISFMCGNAVVTYTDNKTTRTYQTTYMEIPGQSCLLQIYKN